MQIAIGVPQREHGVALTLGGLYVVALHCRILAVDVVKHIWMDEHMIQCGVEDGLLVAGAALHSYAAEVVVPRLASLSGNCLEVLALLLGIEVAASIFDAHKRHSHLHLNLLTGTGVVVDIHANVVAGKRFAIVLIEFIFSGG